MVRVRVRLGYTMAICLVLQHQVSTEIPVYLDHWSAFHGISINYSTYCQARSEQELRQLIMQ